MLDRLRKMSEMQQAEMQQAFVRAPVEPVMDGRPVTGLRKRRPLGRRMVYWLANGLLMPLILTLYAVIVADGLALLVPVMAMRIGRLPIPGAALAANYDGFDRVTLAHVGSMLLFVVVTWLYIRIFDELQGFGSVAKQAAKNPALVYVLTGVALTILGADALLFYAGMTAKTQSGWTESPSYVAPLATLLYTASLAVIGYWHSEYKHADKV
ncbi:MAG: hypothetical protein R3C53_19185 [Pirellulaceae bacterium]